MRVHSRSKIKASPSRSSTKPIDKAALLKRFSSWKKNQILNSYYTNIWKSKNPFSKGIKPYRSSAFFPAVFSRDAVSFEYPTASQLAGSTKVRFGSNCVFPQVWLGNMHRHFLGRPWVLDGSSYLTKEPRLFQVRESSTSGSTFFSYPPKNRWIRTNRCLANRVLLSFQPWNKDDKLIARFWI